MWAGVQGVLPHMQSYETFVISHNISGFRTFLFGLLATVASWLSKKENVVVVVDGYKKL